MNWNPGQLLKSGQYEIIRQIGNGAFGSTYLAIDYNLERKVVIKRPKLSYEADRDYEKILRRFKREGKVLAQIQISNIVRVIEFAEIDRMPCLVMDFVEGKTLKDYILDQGSIAEVDAWPLFKKLATALDALHKQGLIHCDIHPDNIIIQPNGEPVLIDFGSTKFLSFATWTMTGTINEYSPYEQSISQKKGYNPEANWDIYSLAANMFFVVTGEKPLSALTRKLSKDTFETPKKIKPELSDRLNKMIMCGLALEAVDRPISIEEWINPLTFKEKILKIFNQLLQNIYLIQGIALKKSNQIVTVLEKINPLTSNNKNRLLLEIQIYQQPLRFVGASALLVSGVYIYALYQNSLEVFEENSYSEKPIPPLVMTGGDPYIRSLMRTISSNDFQPYSLIYGGNRAEKLDKHPSKCVTIQSEPKKGDCSTAAGRYYITNTTWYDIAKRYQGKQICLMWQCQYSFAPLEQDKVVYAWLSDSQFWEINISKELQNGKITTVLKKLSPTWTNFGHSIENSKSDKIFDTTLNEELQIAK
jgi:muramidase (phage lysozyme)/tRNA A-37 threonylcarbamoyl transferase component Bud32